MNIKNYLCTEKQKTRMKVVFDLKKVMSKYGLKQIEVAHAAELSPVTISNICRGIAYPSVQSLIAISEHLDIPIEDFFQVMGIKKKKEHDDVIFCPHCRQEIGIRLYIPPKKQKDE